MSRGPDKQFDRDQALDKAMNLFWGQGYEATGVADLLSHMGIGRQSLYDTFGSKRDLFLESLRRYFGDQMNEVGALLQGPGTTIEKLEALFENRLQFAEEPGARGCLVGNTAAELGPHDPEVAETVRHFLDQIQQGIAELLQAGQEAGDIRRDMTPTAMASLIVVTVQGGALFSKIEPDLKMGRGALQGLLESLKPV